MMMPLKKTFLSIYILLSIIQVQYQKLNAQYADNTISQYPEVWNSRWITHPDIDETAYNLIHFRKSFQLDTKPESFIIQVSGDNRYRLYVNGEEVGYGPQLADMRHWRYETFDLAPFLKQGKNIIAAEVMNWGADRSYGIMSHKTGFMIQGNSELENILNTTTTNNWKVYKNRAVHEKTVLWLGGGEIINGFYAANPTDSIVAKDYPWDWKALSYNDEEWKTPKSLLSRPRLNAGAGMGWILQPRTTKMQTSQKENLTKIARSTMKDFNVKDFQFGKKPLKIPANSKETFLIDQTYVTLGYPKIQLSKGKDATIKVTYAEALYDAQNKKGNRNEIEGKIIRGMNDMYVMDGSDHRTFQPLWFRTFRFVQIEVITQDEPLLIDDFYNVYSATDFPVQASFETDNPLYKEIWDVCWHTMKICAQDNLMSDAYYEQMQYVGDLRPHLMGWTALTGDLSYFKSAIQQFNNSRLPDGNITSCYPLKATFVHPTYSLMWIDMLHDLMMLTGDKSEIEPYLGEIQEVFDYFESLITKEGVVGPSKYEMFVDWYESGHGMPDKKDTDNSAILTLNYAYSLKNASDILNWLGYRAKAKEYLDQSIKYAEITRNLCFDQAKGIYGSDANKSYFDQRASILAVLDGAHSEAESKALMQKILDSNTHFDSHANLFYDFYLFKAMEKTGVGNYTAQLKPWQELVEMGMSGTPEKRIEQDPRSEIHPWTSHPVHFYFSLVAGIRPTAPGFETIEIAPNPGDLKTVHATYPTIKGPISMEVSFGKNGKVTGEVNLPDRMQGVFKWKGKQMDLKAGPNTIEL